MSKPVSAWMERFSEKIDDGLNPILVKNLRQALHGKFLHRTYTWSLIGATGAGFLALLWINNEPDSSSGQEFLAAIYFAFCVGVVGILPLSALITGDTDRARAEKLFLSPLSAAAIVRGRLWATLGQGGILALALLPFMSLSLILPGVDLSVLVVVVLNTLLVGISLAAVGVGISSFVQHRLLQAFVTAVMAVGQIFTLGMTFMAGAELIDRPNIIQDHEFWGAMAVIWLHFIFAIVFSLCLGQKGVARPEEDGERSGRRAMLTLFMMGLCLQWSLPLLGVNVRGGDMDELSQYFTLAFAAGLAPFVVDKDALPTQLQGSVPSSRLKALLQVPFIQGHGRGMLLFWGMMLIWALCWGLLPAPIDPSSTMSSKQYDHVWEGGFRTIVYLGLTTPLLRLLPRALAGLLAVPLIGLFWMGFGITLEFIDALFRSFHWRLDHFFFEEEGLELLFVAALLINLPFVLRGIAQVMTASEEQEAREMAMKGQVPNG